MLRSPSAALGGGGGGCSGSRTKSRTRYAGANIPTYGGYRQTAGSGADTGPKARDAQENSGSGGGGSGNGYMLLQYGGNGGSGLVLIAYPT